MRPVESPDEEADGVRSGERVELWEREFFIDNLLVRIHFIIVMIRWTGLAPWVFEFPIPGSRPVASLPPEEADGVRSGERVALCGTLRTTCESVVCQFIEGGGLIN